VIFCSIDRLYFTVFKPIFFSFNVTKINMIFSTIKMKVSLCFYIFSLGLFMVTVSGFGTHIKGGYVYAQRMSNQDFTYRITFVGFRDKNAGILDGGSFSLGDGTTVSDNFEVIETRSSNGHIIAKFSIVHTYQTVGTYTISYKESSRNSGIANIQNSVVTDFYVETSLIIDPFLGTVNTPVLLDMPILEAEGGKRYLFTPILLDSNQDSIVFNISRPFEDKNMPVAGFISLTSAMFYSNLGSGNHAGNGPPGFSINPYTGTIDWDVTSDVFNLSGTDCHHATAYSEFTINFSMTAYRKIQNSWYYLSKTLVEYQIEVKNTDHLPEVYVENEPCTESGDYFEFEIDAKSDIHIVFTNANEIAAVNDIPFQHDTLFQAEGLQAYRIDFNQNNIFPRQVIVNVYEENGDLITSFSFYSIENCPVILTVPTDQPKSVAIYPNPSSDFLLFSTEKHSQHYQIMELNGKVISTGTITNDPVDIRQLANGMYIVSIRDNFGAFHKYRLIKQNTH